MMPRILPLLLIAALLPGCVTKSKYEALETSAEATRTEMQTTIDGLQQELDAANARIAELEPMVAGLSQDKSQLTGRMQDMARALEAERNRQAAAEARIAEFRQLVDRFKDLIDAGTLKVQIVNGRMVLNLATDILFPSGSAKLSPAGKDAITQVATVLQSIPKREFQVEGHTDNVPIKTDRYGSNWDLAYGRALTVVETMIGAGMAPERLSAASFGEFRPVTGNDTPEGKTLNRRIEIVVVPDLSGLPGFDELNKISAERKAP